MATVLVIGGTGLVGRPTVRQLLRAGHTVYSMSRSGEKLGSEVALKCDLGSSDWTQALQEIKTSIEVLVYSTFSTSSDLAYDRRINVEAFKEAFEATNPAQTIYISSVGALGSNLPSGDYSETSPRIGDSAYARDKIDASAYLQTKVGLTRGTVLLPSNIYDERSSRVRYYRDLLTQGYFVYKRDGKGIYNIVHAEDVARAVVCAMSNSAAPLFAEYVVNGEHLEFKDWVGMIEKKFDLTTRTKLPRGLESIIRGPIRKVVAKLGVRSPMRIPEPKATTYEAKIRYQSDKLCKELGWTATHMARDVLSKTSAPKLAP